MLAVISNRRMLGVLSSPETLALTRATWRNTPENDIKLRGP
jgi:hypothetical protein